MYVDLCRVVQDPEKPDFQFCFDYRIEVLGVDLATGFPVGFFKPTINLPKLSTSLFHSNACVIRVHAESCNDDVHLAETTETAANVWDVCGYLC